MIWIWVYIRSDKHLTKVFYEQKELAFFFIKGQNSTTKAFFCCWFYINAMYCLKFQRGCESIEDHFQNHITDEIGRALSVVRNKKILENLEELRKEGGWIIDVSSLKKIYNTRDERLETCIHWYKIVVIREMFWKVNKNEECVCEFVRCQPPVFYSLKTLVVQLS